MPNAGALCLRADARRGRNKALAADFRVATHIHGAYDARYCANSLLKSPLRVEPGHGRLEFIRFK